MQDNLSVRKNHGETARSLVQTSSMTGPDALSEILTTLRLTTTLYCRSEVTAPWGLRIPARDGAAFHAVRRGACWLRLEDGPSPIPLAAGDLVVLPRGDAHILSDAPRRRADDLAQVLACRAPGEHGPLVRGGGGAPSTLLCGHFGFARDELHPLLSMLPPVLVLRGDDGRAGPWLEGTLELLARESAADRPGAAAVLARATDILFVQTIRAYLDSAEAPPPGWLGGLKDPHVAAALAVIHREPGAALDVEVLARAAGQSRSAFCARFRDLVGEPPHKYLLRWRMHSAASRLRDGGPSLQELAAQVGFADEASFSKAFKRHLGVSPGAFRRRHAGSQATQPGA
jgi:AraC family transcriptional regulator, alkane utilization regulator